MSQLIKNILPALIILNLGSCLGGCTFKTKDNASWQLTFGSQVGVNTTSSTTQAEGTVSTEFPSAEAWIFSKAKVAEKEVEAKNDNVIPGAPPATGEPTPAVQPTPQPQ